LFKQIGKLSYSAAGLVTAGRPGSRNTPAPPYTAPCPGATGR